jgi:hypothetical protein
VFVTCGGESVAVVGKRIDPLVAAYLFAEKDKPNKSTPEGTSKPSQPEPTPVTDEPPSGRPRIGRNEGVDVAGVSVFAWIPDGVVGEIVELDRMFKPSLDKLVASQNFKNVSQFVKNHNCMVMFGPPDLARGLPSMPAAGPMFYKSWPG